MTTGKIGIAVSTLHYEADRRIMESALRSLELMVHEKGTFAIGEPQYAMDWYFFSVFVDYELLRKVINFMGSEFFKTKNKTLQDRFLDWLAVKLQENKSKAMLDLVERKESTKYGLF